MGRPRKNLKRVIVDSSNTSADQASASSSTNSAVSTQSDGHSSTKKKRGPTKMKNIWKQAANERIPVEINDDGQPIGDSAAAFSSFCGVIARNRTLCPLGYQSWSKVPYMTKMSAISVIKQYFSFPAAAESWVDLSISTKWRGYKCHLKSTYYKAEKSEIENAMDVPPSVNARDWEYLVRYWKSEKGKARAEANTKSQISQHVNHITGSASFAVVRDNQDKKRDEPIGDVEFYKLTHMTETGTFADSDAEKNVALAEKLLAERSEAALLDPLATEKAIMIEVQGENRKGRRGRGLLKGNGRKARAVENEVTELRNEVRELKDMVVQLVKMIPGNNN